MGLMDLFRLDGRVAVVTGAGKGIGRGIALGLADAGADVVVVARTKADIDAVATDITDRGRRSLAIAADATSYAEMERAADRAISEMGPISIWVNNAGGGADPRPHPLADIHEEKWDEQVDLNLKSAWIGCKLMASRMAEGVLLNISSRAAYGPRPGYGAYGAAKAGLNSLTQTFADELAPRIRVNAICPGPVVTPALVAGTGLDEGNEAAVLEQFAVPLGRFGTVDDIATAAIYLVSPAASWVTGSILYVTGGR